MPLLCAAALAETVVLSHDIRPGSASSTFGSAVNCSDNLYLVVNNGSIGAELYTFNGTHAVLVKEIIPGSNNSNLQELTIFNNSIWFRATNTTEGAELFASDGTTIWLVKDIAPGYASSAPTYLTAATFIGDASPSIAFRADNGTSGTELNIINASGAHQLIENLRPGAAGITPYSITAYAGTVCFNGAPGGIGEELVCANSTMEWVVNDLYAGASSSSPGNLIVYNNTLFFSGSNATTGQELYAYNGTNITLVADICAGSCSGSYTSPFVYNDTLLFRAYNGSKRMLYAFDGVNAWPVDTSQNFSTFSGPVLFDGKVYFSGNNGSYGQELWAYDGTVRLAADIYPGSTGSSPTLFPPIDDKLFLGAYTSSAGTELMRVVRSPNASTFEPGSTNFSAVANLANITNATLRKGGSSILWPRLDADHEDIDDQVRLGQGFVSVNASSLDWTFNTSARVTVSVVSCDRWYIYHSGGEVWSLADLKANGTLIGSGSGPTGSCTALCSDPLCSGNNLSFTMGHFDGAGGDGEVAAPVPEMQGWALLLALAGIIVGITYVRKN
jgi:ELWxxDGT repeat protein